MAEHRRLSQLTAAMAVALAAMLGLAVASWVVAVRQMNRMDMGVATGLGSFAFFVALWVVMMAAMMLPGAAPAVLRRAHISGGVRAVPLFVGSYLAIWTLVGVAVYAVYRPHGTLVAGAFAIAAGVYELTPLKRHLRRRCHDSVRLWIRVRALLRRLHHWTDADVCGARRHEHHLDVRDRPPRLCPEVTASESCRRCAAGASNRRTWSPHRHHALVDSRTYATDVKKERNHD